MVQENLSKEEQLFLYLISTFRTSAWIALGKIKNPVTDNTEVNLDQASYYVDLLDMLQTKARGRYESAWPLAEGKQNSGRKHYTIVGRHVDNTCGLETTEPA